MIQHIRRRIERSQQIAASRWWRREQRARSRGTVSPTQPDGRDHGLTMPEMDGSMREELVAINSKVLILVVSALADKATAVDAIEGSERFLCKPFTDRQSMTR